MKQLFSLQLFAVLFTVVFSYSAQAQAPTWQNAIATGGSTTTVTATAVNATGDVYLTGYFNNTVTLGTTTLVSQGLSDLFVAKWNATRNSFDWAQRAGSIDMDIATDIVVNSNSIYITGNFSSRITFGNSTLVGAGITGSDEIFVAKLMDAGASGSFTWALRAGSTAVDYGQAIAVNGNSIYIAGEFQSPATFGSYTLATAGDYDTFVAKIIDAGNTADFAWAQKGGGTGREYTTGLAVAGSNVYVAGLFAGSSATFGNTALTNSGTTGLTSDSFVAKLTDNGAAGTFVWALQSSGTDSEDINDIVEQDGNLYVAGTFDSPAATFGSSVLTNASATSDMFVAKIRDAGNSANFTWALRGGGTGIESANALAVNNASIYVAGVFGSAATTTFGPFTLAGAGISDGFLTKINDNGTTPSFSWALLVAGTGRDEINDVQAVGQRVYVAGTIRPAVTFGNQTISSPTTNSVGFGAYLTDTPLSAASSAAAAGLVAYPNPAHDHVQVQIPVAFRNSAATLTLYNHAGQVVFVHQLPSGIDAGETSLPIQNIVPGIYLLRMHSGQQETQKRLLIQ